MIASNPFTPQSGWEPRVFGGRKEAISFFQTNLEESIKARPNHLIVLGEWGIGKTSLLKQFRRIAQKEGFPACFCGISRFTKNDKPIDIFRLIAEEILIGLPLPGVDAEGLLKIFSKKSYGGHVQIRFMKFLLELWELAKARLIIVFIDDLQNLLPISNSIDILRAVLSEDHILDKTRYLFVLSSTPSGWTIFMNKHDPIGRFFRRRLNIGRLTKEEVIDTVTRTLYGTGVDFESDIKEKIYEYTKGHPYEVQLLSSHLYDAQIEGVVSGVSWESALTNTLNELGKNYFDSLFCRASDRERVLLKILCEEDRSISLKEFRTLMIVGRYAKKFPIANIKNFLYRLEEKGIIIRDGSGNFDIPDKMFREYMLRKS